MAAASQEHGPQRGTTLSSPSDGEDRKLAPLLAELGDRARLRTIREAAEFGETVLFSVYCAAGRSDRRRRWRRARQESGDRDQ